MFMLILISIFELDPKRPNRSEIFIKEVLRFFEIGEYDSANKMIKKLERMGYKKEAIILKNLVLLKEEKWDSLNFKLKELPDFIKGFYLYNKDNIIDKHLFKELTDTLKFYLIFYFQDIKEINSYLDSLTLPEKYKRLAEGYILFREEKFKEATNIFKEVYKEWQEDFIAELIVLSYTHLRNWDSIISFGQKVKSNIVQYCVGTSYYNKGFFNEAKEIFQKETLGIFRKHALFALGWIHFRIENYKESIIYFEKFLNEYKDELEVPALYRIGRSYLRLGNIKALSYFKDILKRFPDSDFSDDALFLLGKTYYSKNVLDSAKKYFYKLVVDYPDSRWFSFSNQYLGDIHFLNKDFKKAKNYYNIAMKFNLPKTYLDEIEFKNEYIDYIEGKYRGELEFYKSFISKYPKNSKIPEICEKIGDIYSISKRYKEAEMYWRKIVEEFEEYQYMQEIILKLFKLYAKTSQIEEKGIPMIEEMIKKEVTGKDNLIKEVGDYFFETGEYSKAIDYYNRIEDEKLKLLIYYKLSYSYFKMELLDETKVLSKLLLEEYPNSPFYDKTFLLLLQCLMKEGNEEEINDLLNFKQYKISNDTKIEANISLGNFYCSKKDEKALEYYMRAIVLCGNNFEKASTIFFMAADCAQNLGLKEKAEDLRKKGLLIKK